VAEGEGQSQMYPIILWDMNVGDTKMRRAEFVRTIEGPKDMIPDHRSIAKILRRFNLIIGMMPSMYIVSSKDVIEQAWPKINIRVLQKTIDAFENHEKNERAGRNAQHDQKAGLTAKRQKGIEGMSPSRGQKVQPLSRMMERMYPPPNPGSMHEAMDPVSPKIGNQQGKSQLQDQRPIRRPQPGSSQFTESGPHIGKNGIHTELHEKKPAI